jgi:hypothetical protein
MRARIPVLVLMLALLGGVSPASAAPPDGTLAIGVHAYEPAGRRCRAC